MGQNPTTVSQWFSGIKIFRDQSRIIFWRMLMSATRLCFLILLTLAGNLLAPAQANVNEEQSLKRYDAWHGGDLDSISMTGGGLALHIPLLSFPQRGNLDLSFSIYRSSKQWRTRINSVECNNPNDSNGCTPYWIPIVHGIEQNTAVDFEENGELQQRLDYLRQRLGILPPPSGARAFALEQLNLLPTFDVQLLYGGNLSLYAPEVAGGTTPNMQAFFTDITNSGFMDLLNQYSTIVAGGTNQTIEHSTFDGLFTIVPSAANNGRTIDDGVRTPCARADQCFGSSTRVSNVIQNRLMEAV
jgi:hypothetical protein